MAASLLASALGGALYVLAFPGVGWWPLAAVFVVPLWWAFEREAGVLRAGLCGFVFGAAAYAGGHPWLLELVDVFLAGDRTIGMALWLAYGLWFAAGFALYGVSFAWLRARGLGFVTAALPTWILVEWLQPLLFPVHCGAALINALPLAQLASLGGPLLLSAQVLVSNAVVYESLRCRWQRAAAPRALWLASAVALLLPPVFGYAEERRQELRSDVDRLDVGIVQVNLGLLEKRTRAIVGHRKHLEQTHEMLAAEPAGEIDLVIWPETAYAQAIRGPFPVSGMLVRQDLDVPLLFGGPIIDQPGPDGRHSNAALLIDRDGMIRSAYRKNLLIPLAEFVPFARLWPGLAERLPHAQSFTASQAKTALVLDSFRIAAPICYEAVRPGFVRELVAQSDANLIVTLANDAWFGDSREPQLHLQLARLRAIEHRLFMVRATNSGISAIIDPAGRILARTGVSERANLRGAVRAMSGRTIYALVGDWPPVVAAFWLGFALLRAPRRLVGSRAGAGGP